IPSRIAPIYTQYMGKNHSNYATMRDN
ncbi:hypothetical protein VCHENC02_3802B, partial [Vibrio harveyi]